MCFDNRHRWAKRLSTFNSEYFEIASK
jgi:hypothetical protein